MPGTNVAQVGRLHRTKPTVFPRAGALGSEAVIGIPLGGVVGAVAEPAANEPLDSAASIVAIAAATTRYFTIVPPYAFALRDGSSRASGRVGRPAHLLLDASATATTRDTPWKSGCVHAVTDVAERARPWTPKASAKYAISVPHTFGRLDSCEAPRKTAATAGNR